MQDLTSYCLPRSTPEQQGIASSAISQFIDLLQSQIHDLHSFMLLRHGNVVAEGWWSPYQREYPHMLYSLSKSFTSTAVGMAIAEGYFSIDDLVLPFFTDDVPAEVNTNLAAMRVRHLLTMTTGHADDTWWHMAHREDGNWIRAFFGVPVVHEPGTHFLYNTGATYLLSAVVQKTTGQKLVDFLKPRLFEPLGIETAAWEESPQGINLGGIGLSVRTEDIACFGQLYLQKGMWQGQQLLPTAWVNDATACQVSNGDSPYSDWTQGYGYQFWRCRHGAYRGDGVFGQYCVIMPEQDAVLVITGGLALEDMQQPLDLLWDCLLPAMGSEQIAEDVEAHRLLTEKLSNLHIPPLKAQATSPTSTVFSGQSYQVDANELQIEDIRFDVVESGWLLSFKIAHGEEQIPVGYGEWKPGQTILLDEPQTSALHPVATSGGWTAEDTFTVVMRLVETPFYQTLVFNFMGDDLLVETGVNLSLEAAPKQLLTARRLHDKNAANPT